MENYSADLYERVKLNFPDDNELTASEIFDLIRIAMEEAEKITDLTGPEKKELVIRVVHEAFKDLVVDKIESDKIQDFMDFFLEYLVDQFVDISKGNLKINDKTKKVLKKIFPCCK